MIRTVQIKIRPSKDQADRLCHWLDLSRWVYNACLEQRILAYRQSLTWDTTPGNLTTKFGQMGQLPELKDLLPECKEINAQVLQDTVGRVDKAFKAFFKRNKTTKTGGFPRFKSASRFDSFTHPQAREVKFSKDSRRFYLPSFGWLGYHQQGPNARSLDEGTLKTLTIKRKADGWWASFSVEIPKPATLPQFGQTVGLDLGLTNLVTLSTGEVLGSLKAAKATERKIRLTQAELSKKTRGSNRRKKSLTKLQKQSLRHERAKKQQLHEISKKLVQENDVICVEDLNIKGMLKPKVSPSLCNPKGLRRNIGLASWATLVYMLDYKAEEAGRQVIKVDPKGTSQECSGCGKVGIRKDLTVRVHECPHCGLILDRDLNAALNVLARGTGNQRGSIVPTWNPKGRRYEAEPPLGDKREVGELGDVLMDVA